MSNHTITWGKKMGAAEKLVAEVVDSMDDQDRVLLLEWSKKAKTIVDSPDKPRKQKLSELYELKTSPIVKSTLISLARLAKTHAWDNRSWSARFALSGLGVGAVTLGSQSAGIAAFGGAIGVPLFLLTSAGGALLGVLIDEISKSTDKNSTNGKGI